MTIELHPLSTLFPRMGDAEFDALVADIRANGLRDAITLHDGMILDGGNRYRACLAAGVEPTFRRFDGPSIVSYVLSANLHRRHLTPGQQAAIVASAKDWAQAQTHGGKRRGSDQAATLPLETVQQRAAESGASERTQRMADKVAKQDPNLAKKVAHGEVSLPKAVAMVSKQAETTIAQELAKANASSLPACEPPAKQEARKPGPVTEPEHDEDELESVEELVQGLQADLDKALATIETLKSADHDKATLHTLIVRVEHAERQRDTEMEKAARLSARVARLERDLRSCGKAVGELDQDKIVAAVQAFARKAKESA